MSCGVLVQKNADAKFRQNKNPARGAKMAPGGYAPRSSPMHAACLLLLALVALASAAPSPAAFSYWNYATYLGDPTCSDLSMVAVATTSVNCFVCLRVLMRSPYYRSGIPKLIPLFA